MLKLSAGRSKVTHGVGRYFFDRAAGLKQIGAAQAKLLSKAGAFVQRRARSNLNRRQKRKALADLTPEEREKYDVAVARAKEQGRPKPKVWFRVYSRPGEPPRTATSSSLLRRLLYFAYDRGRQTVVVGPAKLNKAGEVPSVLEFGGRVKRGEIAPRPYMRPALEAEAPKFPELFKGLIR